MKSETKKSNRENRSSCVIPSDIYYLMLNTQHKMITSCRCGVNPTFPVGAVTALGSPHKPRNK